MRRDDGGSSGGVFSGIDPDRLKGTIDSVQRDQEKLEQSASYYKTELAWYGLGAEDLGAVLQVARWARDELPMLKRRYHLAQNLENVPYPGFDGMVQINEGAVSRAASTVATKAAKRATELAKKNPEDLTPEEFDELNALFAENYNEYPFAEKVIGALGARKTLQLWDSMSNLGRSPGYGQTSGFKRGDELKEMQKNLSLTVAAATNSDTAEMRQWKKDMVALGDDPIREPGPAPHGDSGGPDGFIVMSNLMRYGDYDDKFLVDYGAALIKEDRRVMANADGPYGSGWGTTSQVNHIGNDEGNDPLTGYMKALAHSPAAATEFFSAKQKGDDGKAETNFKYLFEARKWPDDSMPGEESVTGRNSMGHALEAATTGHRPSEAATNEDLKHSKEQARLFTSLVESVAQDPERLRSHEYLSDSFANISAEYMPDLQTSLDSDIKYGDRLYPTTGARAQIDAYDAARFLHALSRNKEGYDRLNVAQHVYAAALMEAQVKNPGAYPQSTDDTIDQIAYDTGLFQGVIGGGQHFQAAGDTADAATREDAWKEPASTWGGSLVGSAAAIATASFTGPGGVVVGGLVGTAAGEVFSGLLDGFGGDDGKQKEQVYQNVKRLDHIQHSAILTTQESVQAATGDEAAASRAGARAGDGFNSANDLIDYSGAAQ